VKPKDLRFNYKGAAIQPPFHYSLKEVMTLAAVEPSVRHTTVLEIYVLSRRDTDRCVRASL